VAIVAKRPASQRKQRPTAKSAKPVPFWRKYSHPDLDGSGDWLLRNIGEMRAQALARGLDR